jgi:hypothetical protein
MHLKFGREKLEQMASEHCNCAFGTLGRADSLNHLLKSCASKIDGRVVLGTRAEMLVLEMLREIRAVEILLSLLGMVTVEVAAVGSSCAVCLPVASSRVCLR